MRKFDEREETFDEIYQLLKKCINYEVAQYIYSQYEIRSITETKDNKHYIFVFVEDGVYYLQFTQDWYLIHCKAVDYSKLATPQQWEIIEHFEKQSVEENINTFDNMQKNKIVFAK